MWKELARLNKARTRKELESNVLVELSAKKIRPSSME
jgi:hypothetical protein